jgi:hypothetical protein
LLTTLVTMTAMVTTVVTMVTTMTMMVTTTKMVDGSTIVTTVIVTKSPARWNLVGVQEGAPQQEEKLAHAVPDGRLRPCLTSRMKQTTDVTVPQDFPAAVPAACFENGREVHG